MTEAVLLTPDGSVIRGTYSGYGELHMDTGGNASVCGKIDPCLYHAACYAAAGNPPYSSPSHPADDQGHFTIGHPSKPKTRERKHAKAR